ncbi:MAG: ATP-binding protein [Desulfobacterales bacterium]|nr:MAG: ATP-binding protein [Desulfobacterales bacterium]
MGKISEMSTGITEKTVGVVLANELGYERIAMACSASFAEMMGFAAERIEDLKTVVSEAAINAMQHGNKGRPDAKVAVFMNFSDDAINVSVTDEGDGIKDFPPTPDIARIIDNLDPPVGFGLLLIKQLADRVEFNKMTDGGHEVKMTIAMQT